MSRKVINKREEAIVLQEIARQENIILWYNKVNKPMTDLAEEKLKVLKVELEKIRET